MAELQRPYPPASLSGEGFGGEVAAVGVCLWFSANETAGITR